jgi:hypothetical protein
VLGALLGGGASGRSRCARPASSDGTCPPT